MLQEIDRVVCQLKLIQSVEWIEYHHFIVIATKMSVSLPKAKHFVLKKYQRRDIDWRQMTSDLIAMDINQCINQKDSDIMPEVDAQTEKQLILLQNILTKIKMSEQKIKLNQLLKKGNGVYLREYNQNENKQRIKLQHIVQALQQEQQRKRNIMIKRMKGIFHHYCKDNDSKGATFSQIDNNTNTLDLTHFLKYYKHFQLQQAVYAKANQIVQIFKNQALNGQWLDFNAFWKLNEQIFALQPHPYSRRQIVEADKQKLQNMKDLLNQQINALRRMNKIITKEKTNANLRLFQFNSNNLVSSSSNPNITKTLPNEPQQRLKQFQSAILPSRNQSLKSIRSQIWTNPESSKSQQKTKASRVVVSLPKILKLSQQEISKQDIYKSLKKFAVYQLAAQERKLKDILGISNYNDQPFISALIQRENSQKSQKKSTFLSSKLQPIKHCPRFSPTEVQPYMKFS